MNYKIRIALIALVAGMATLTACDKDGAGTKKSNNVGTFVCDKSFENVIRQEMIVYENVYPKAYLGCQYVTESEAIERLMSGETRLAVVGRDLTKAEFNKLKNNKETQNVRSMKIAVDAIALIINPDNPVDTLSMRQIASILRGDITNWNQTQPGAPDLPVKVIVDDPGSGVTSYIRNKVIDGQSFDPKVVVTADSLTGVFERVKANKGYIGIIGSSWLSSDLNRIDKEKLLAILDKEEFDQREIDDAVMRSGVKTVKIMYNSLKAYGPDQANIYSGDYPLTRPIYMITTASPAGTLGKFYSFVTGVDGQKIVLQTGVMPARLSANIYEIAQ